MRFFERGDLGWGEGSEQTVLYADPAKWMLPPMPLLGDENMFDVGFVGKIRIEVPRPYEQVAVVRQPYIFRLHFLNAGCWLSCNPPA